MFSLEPPCSILDVATEAKAQEVSHIVAYRLKSKGNRPNRILLMWSAYGLPRSYCTFCTSAEDAMEAEKQLLDFFENEDVDLHFVNHIPPEILESLAEIEVDLDQGLPPQ
jgi:hypothetical protein